MPHPYVDPVKADSKHYTVEFENDKVRVVRIRYGTREKSVMHSLIPSPFLYACTIAKRNSPIQMPGARTSTRRSGQVLHMDAFESGSHYEAGGSLAAAGDDR